MAANHSEVISTSGYTGLLERKCSPTLAAKGTSLPLANFLALLSSRSLMILLADACSSSQQENRVQKKERLLDDPLYLFVPGCISQTIPGISPELNHLKHSSISAARPLLALLLVPSEAQGRLTLDHFWLAVFSYPLTLLFRTSVNYLGLQQKSRI